MFRRTGIVTAGAFHKPFAAKWASAGSTNLIITSARGAASSSAKKSKPSRWGGKKANETSSAISAEVKELPFKVATPKVSMGEPTATVVSSETTNKKKSRSKKAAVSTAANAAVELNDTVVEVQVSSPKREQKQKKEKRASSTTPKKKNASSSQKKRVQEAEKAVADSVTPVTFAAVGSNAEGKTVAAPAAPREEIAPTQQAAVEPSVAQEKKTTIDTPDVAEAPPVVEAVVEAANETVQAATAEEESITTCCDSSIPSESVAVEEYDFSAKTHHQQAEEPPTHSAEIATVVNDPSTTTVVEEEHVPAVSAAMTVEATAVPEPVAESEIPPSVTAAVVSEEETPLPEASVETTFAASENLEAAAVSTFVDESVDEATKEEEESVFQAELVISLPQSPAPEIEVAEPVAQTFATPTIFHPEVKESVVSMNSFYCSLDAAAVSIASSDRGEEREEETYIPPTFKATENGESSIPSVEKKVNEEFQWKSLF